MFLRFFALRGFDVELREADVEPTATTRIAYTSSTSVAAASGFSLVSVRVCSSTVVSGEAIIRE